MGNKPGVPSPCAIPLDSGFERWNGIKGIHFNSSCVFNATIINSLYSGLVTWIVATATSNLNDAISKKLPRHTAAQRAAVWGATFGVSFATAFFCYLLLRLFFGYGGGLLSLTRSQYDQRLQVSKLQQQQQRVVQRLGPQQATRQGFQRGTQQGKMQGAQQASKHAQHQARKLARHQAKAVGRQVQAQHQAQPTG